MHTFPNILAIETSGQCCSIALLKKKVFFYCKTQHKFHEQYVLPMIRDIFVLSQSNIHEIHVIAYGHGPGSYTGIRIATNVAQGLSFGLSIPIIQIPTLEILAQQAWRKTKTRRILSVISAKNNKILWEKYSRVSPGYWIKEEHTISLERERIDRMFRSLNKGWIIAKNFIPQCCVPYRQNALYELYTYPLAIDILPLALQRWNTGKIFYSHSVFSRYIKDTFCIKIP